MRSKIAVPGCLIAAALSVWLLAPGSAGPGEARPRQHESSREHADHHEHAAHARADHRRAVDGNADPATLAYWQQMEEVEAKLERDPVAQKIPMLFDTPPEKQLETLRWMKELPRDTLMSAIPSLGTDRSIPMSVRREMAVDVVDDLILELEERAAAERSLDAGEGVPTG
jgi:hypothetical protein